MEDYYNVSTDEEFGMDLQLVERLRINRSDHNSQEKRYNNQDEIDRDNKYTEMLEDFIGASSSSSLEINNGASSSNEILGASCSNDIHSSLLPNKKRQNGDKIREHLANPKRTCLNGRLHNCKYKWKNSKMPFNAEKSHNSGKPESKFPYGKSYLPERDLSPAQLYENNTKNIINFNNSDDSDLEISFTKPSHRNISHKINKKSNIFKKSALSLPKSGIVSDPYEGPSVSKCNVLDDSESENDLNTPTTSGALKGGKQSPECFHHNKKVVGRRMKALDSDDSENEMHHFPYRNLPLQFSSSDSESSKIDIKTKKTEPVSKHACSRERESFKNQSKLKHGRTWQAKFKSTASPESSNHHLPHSASSPDVHNKCYRTRSFRSRHNTGKHNGTSPHFSHSPPNFLQSSRNTGPVRGRNRMNRCERPTVRSSSPNFRVTRSQRRAESSSSAGRSHKDNRKCDLSIAYPDIFDAEESSEVEFFTANSYSDTETSNESIPHYTIKRFIPCSDTPSGTNMHVERSINLVSSEDEISVLFASAPRTNTEQRRRSRGSNRRGSRGRMHRCHQNAEVVSLSPDPVEQVRQMEDDERYARILQAQYDAELDPDFVPPLLSPLPQLSSDSDDEIYPIEIQSNVFLPSTIMERTSTAPRRGIRLGHPYRGRHPIIFPTNIPNNRRQSRNRRRTYVTTDSLFLPLRRLINIESLTEQFDDDDQYETLLQLVEANGDVVQRGLEKSEINRLPTRKYIVANGAAASNNQEVTHKRTELNKECQVCLCDYESGDILRILPCFHEFHTPCIDPWLKINHTCPVCRVTVDVAE